MTDPLQDVVAEAKELRGYIDSHYQQRIDPRVEAEIVFTALSPGRSGDE